ncbi:RNA binding protein [Cyclospora cayetanensis]|uniref:RNA binding protein n=1 Tax=Cyclospora cayetanensis TaxID=88456 RepID=A0A1D3CVU4_9EIME|nr:RNA binding protein [Cyclospora cayetanensis]
MVRAYRLSVVVCLAGLPWPRLEGMLRRSFGYCGTILAVVPRKDGEAWIQFADVAACRTALAEMQNAKVGGHAVSVERGNRIPTSAPTVGGGMWGSPTPMWTASGPYAFSSNTGSTVIVSNVPLDLTTEEISDAFSCVGGVAGCDLLLNSSGVHTGRVAVSFSRRSEAMEAVRRFDGGDLNGQVIRVFLE